MADIEKIFEEDKRKQEMCLNLMKFTAKAFKDEFPTFKKLVQMDVYNQVKQGAEKDGILDSDSINMLENNFDNIIGQIGKDLEKQIQNRFEVTFAKYTKK